MAKLDNMTVDELNAELTRLHGEQRRILDEKKKVAGVLDRKVTEQAVRDKLARMNDAERAALAQMVRAGGIESQNAVGVPGAG
jgi:hypothetical protein